MCHFCRLIKGLLIVVALLAVAACGGSSGGGAPATGQVAVIITDGPTDIYERVLITLSSMTLIGSGGQEMIFDAERDNAGEPITFDLLQLRDRADFAFSQEVAVGDYNKIRLEITGVTLVDLGDPEDPSDDAEVTLDKLPANGKIDLNPQGPFTIFADKATVVELDIDALRSFQVVETGNGGLRFRPVIFVNVSNDEIVLPNRMTRVFGTVEEVDEENSSLLLCNLQFVAQLDGAQSTDPEACVRVFAATAEHFGDDGIALVDFAALAAAIDAATEPVQLTAIGFASLPGGAAADTVLTTVLNLDAVVTEVGPRLTDTNAGWETTRGAIVTDPTAENCTEPQCVEFQPAGSGTALTVQLQPETRVFQSDGTELSQGDLGAGVVGAFDALRVDEGGVDELRASLMITGSGGPDTLLSGMLSDVMVDIDGDLDILTVDGTHSVCVYEDTDILQIVIDDETISIVDILDPAVLDPSADLQVDIGGELNLDSDECKIDASIVIVE